MKSTVSKSTNVSEKSLKKAKKADRRKRIKRDKWLYVLMLPGIILTLVFKYFPMYGAVIAFKDYNPLKGILGSEWVGFTHFIDFLNAPNFNMLLTNTVKISFYELIFGFLPPIILAIGLNQIIPSWFKLVNSMKKMLTSSDLWQMNSCSHLLRCPNQLLM